MKDVQGTNLLDLAVHQAKQAVASSLNPRRHIRLIATPKQDYTSKLSSESNIAINKGKGSPVSEAHLPQAMSEQNTTDHCQSHFRNLLGNDRPKLISTGATGLIERLPCGHVRKKPHPQGDPIERSHSLHDLCIEHAVYLRIANLPHFLRMIEYWPEQGIVFQGMPGTIIDRLQSEDDSHPISTAQRLAWACDIATALHSLHTAHVIHGDMKPQNILLDESDKAYLIDFSGSWIDTEQGSAFESVRFRLPRSGEDDSTVRTDLFALGSVLYEIMTGMQPYLDLEDDVVEAKFRQGEFPGVDSIVCGRTILQCWESTVDSADDVRRALESLSVEHS